MSTYTDYTKTYHGTGRFTSISLFALQSDFIDEYMTIGYSIDAPDSIPCGYCFSGENDHCNYICDAVYTRGL